MKALVGLFVLVLVLVLPTAAAGPWLQYRGDAARTGWTSDPGPTTFDVVFDVDINATRAWLAPPLVLGDAVWMLSGAPSPSGPFQLTEGPGASMVHRVDLGTADVTVVVELPPELGPARTWASDGTDLFIAAERGVTAVRAATGEPSWDGVRPYPAMIASEDLLTACGFAAVDNGTLYLPCYQAPARGRVVGSGDLDPYYVYVVLAFDTATGELRWAWRHSPAEGTPLADQTQVSTHGGYQAPLVVGHGSVYVVTLEPNRGYLGTCPGAPPADSSGESDQPVLYSLDASTGVPRWENRALGGIAALAFDVTPNPFGLVTAAGRVVAPELGLAAGPDLLYMVSDSVQALDPETGCVIADDHIRAPGEENRNDRAVALARDDLIVHNFADLLRLEASTFNVKWRAATDTGDRYIEGGLIATDRHVFVLDFAGDVAAYALEDGERLWNADLRSDTPAAFSELHAVGEGVYVVGDERGRVLVVGQSGASIRLPPLGGSRTVDPGEALVLDLSATAPGALADDVSFSIRWGDGSSTGWTTEAIQDHTYEDDGTYRVTVQARNAAGQTTSQTLTATVGAAAGPLGDRVPLWAAGLGGIALFAAAATVVAVRTGRRSGDTLTAGGPTQTASLYRDALEDSLDEDGQLAPEDEQRLRALRDRLGLTDRDHAMMLQFLADGRDGRDLAARLRPGDAFLGKYEIVERLGEGGQGVTFRARDTVLDRDVVVKLLHAGGANPEALLTEARTLARLDHPHVVSVHEADRVGSTVFLVMAYVAGGNLDQALAAGPVDPDRFRELARDLLTGLGAVHAAGVVHRDLKPANVLLDPAGRAKLADFGVVHVPGLEMTMAAFRTLEGAVGTVPYMSPEQARGHTVDERSDLYAVALVLYETATGSRLWRQSRHESPVELQMRIAAAGAFDGELPAWAEPLRGWFERALHPVPGDRFAGASQMLAALEEVIG